MVQLITVTNESGIVITTVSDFVALIAEDTPETDIVIVCLYVEYRLLVLVDVVGILIE